MVLKKIRNFLRGHRKIILPLAAVLGVILVAITAVAVLYPFGGRASTQQGPGFEGISSVAAAEGEEKSDSGPENSNAASIGEAPGSSDTTFSADAGDQQAQTSENGRSTSGNNSSQQSSGNAGNVGNIAAHTHIWKDYVTAVTVEDEPAHSEKVTEYHMYYWDTKTWKTSENPDDFKAWEREKLEWMRTYRYENNMPPELFLGYDSNGNPTYENDHSILTYYKTIPAVTHEEQRVEYQYCSICGVRK